MSANIESSMSALNLETVAAPAADNLIYRVKISNLPQYEMSSLKKLFQTYDLPRAKKAPKWDYAYMMFETEEAAKSAIKKLEGVEFKKRILATELSTISQESIRSHYEKKHKNKKTDDEHDTRSPDEKLADQVTPLHNLTYAEQLLKKHKSGTRYVNSLRKKLNALPGLTEKGRSQIAWTESIASMNCEYIDPIASPVINGYRSKCEFTIGKDLSGDNTVGFLLGLYKDGITAVLDPRSCLHVSEQAKDIARAMKDYVDQSKYPVYDRIEKTGVWRTVMTKTQNTGENMIMIQMRNLDLSNEEMEEEKTKLINYWKKLQEESNTNVTTLLLQIWNGDSNGINDKGVTDILIGDGYVHENLLGRRFRISSSAFFQVNTSATELLYSKCAEWCDTDANKKTTLLDLCCGTGTIGITMADKVDKVIGIEMIPEAIEDARINASTNNVTNAEYYAAKVEDKIDVVTHANNEDVVAILDPPRSGVHSSVIQAVRQSAQIQKVIYISCDAKQAMQNFIGLCRPTSNRFIGTPFKPLRAVCVDLFPHTDHSELMIEFVRVKDDQ